MTQSNACYQPMSWWRYISADFPWDLLIIVLIALGVAATAVLA